MRSEMSPDMKVFYLREKEDGGETPRVCGSSGLASALSWSSLPGLQWVVRGGGDLQRAVWTTVWFLFIIITLTICLLAILSLTGKREREK